MMRWRGKQSFDFLCNLIECTVSVLFAHFSTSTMRGLTNKMRITKCQFDFALSAMVLIISTRIP